MNKDIRSHDFRIALILTNNGIDGLTVLSHDPDTREQAFRMCSLLNNCFIRFEKNFKDDFEKLIRKDDSIG